MRQAEDQSANIQEVCLYCSEPYTEVSDHQQCYNRKNLFDQKVAEIKEIFERIQKEINPIAKHIETSQIQFIHKITSSILAIQNEYQKLHKSYEDLEYHLNQQDLYSKEMQSIMQNVLNLEQQYQSFIARHKQLSENEQNQYARNMKEHLLDFMSQNPTGTHVPFDKLEEKLAAEQKVNKIQRIAIFILGLLLILAYFRAPTGENVILQKQEQVFVEKVAELVDKSSIIAEYLQSLIGEWATIDELRKLVSQSANTQQSLSIFGQHDNYNLTLKNETLQLFKPLNLSMTINRNSQFNELVLSFVRQEEGIDGEDILLIDPYSGKASKYNAIVQSFYEKSKQTSNSNKLSKQIDRLTDQLQECEDQAKQNFEENASLQRRLDEAKLVSEKLKEENKNVEIQLKAAEQQYYSQQKEQNDTIANLQNDLSNYQQEILNKSQELIKTKEEEIQIKVQYASTQTTEEHVEVQDNQPVISLNVSEQIIQDENTMSFVYVPDELEPKEEEVVNYKSLFHSIHSYLLLALFSMSIIVLFKSFKKPHLTDFLIMQGSIGIVQEVFFWLEIFIYNDQYMSAFTCQFLNVMILALIGAKFFVHILLK